ncbi:hypothetical protein ACVWZM_001773 [Bradyrhizobium sp. USDA 4501]
MKMRMPASSCLDGGMNASLDLLSGKFGKLNLVDPGRRSRREVDMIVRPASEPRFNLRCLVGGVVVHDDMDIEPFRDLNTDLFEKLQELDRSVELVAFANDKHRVQQTTWSYHAARSCAYDVRRRCTRSIPANHSETSPPHQGRDGPTAYKAVAELRFRIWAQYHCAFFRMTDPAAACLCSFWFGEARLIVSGSTS